MSELIKRDVNELCEHKMLKTICAKCIALEEGREYLDIPDFLRNKDNLIEELKEQVKSLTFERDTLKVELLAIRKGCNIGDAEFSEKYAHLNKYL